MTRFYAFAFLALLPMVVSFAYAEGQQKEMDVKIEGKLTEDDPKDMQRKAASKVHLAKMKAGNVYTIDMVSMDFDAYLRLEDKDKRQLAEDDDSGGGLNARIVFACTKDGEYRVICTAFAENGFGNYTLTIKSSVNTAKNVTSHEVMLGKAAPDLQGDFAVNGKAGKLSDFKGKVVLLEFCDLRQEECVTALGRLEEWNKSYKSGGFEVLSVTFYNSEMGQRIGFDKSAGKLINAKEATRQSDQSTLKEFASHHKLTHRLMALTKEDALKAFDAYSVNGVPQAVLIDRKGMVRMIRIGDSKSFQAMENEIKKLLEEK